MRKNTNNIEERIANAEQFKLSLETGLTSDQVNSRVKEKLTNKIKKKVTKSIGKIFFDNLINPLNVILLSIFILMTTAGLPITRYFFIIILLANSGIGLIQDFKARSLVSKLTIITEPRTFVLRDGQKQEILNDNIVLSDIIFLNTGDQVPADCELVEGTCAANESLLTGESVAINKIVGDKLFSGSFLTSGHIKARVAAVGGANYSEQLTSKAAAFKKTESEIKSSANKIIYFCIASVLFFGLYSTIISLVNGSLVESYAGENGFVDSLAGSLISMVPSGMYLLTSLTLAVGVILLAQKRMLVQELYCIEMLARVDTICLDKTGTLTDNNMNVEDILTTGSLSVEEVKELVRGVIYSVNDDNATAVALKKFLPKGKEIESVKALPFDSKRKYSAAQFKNGSTAAIGAYGFVNVKKNQLADDLIAQKSNEGFRVICVYSNSQPFNEQGMPLASNIEGIILISNAVKPDAPVNIKWFQNNGVDVKIISGDNPLTVSHIANLCGVKNSEKYLNCEDITPEELKEKAQEYVVFGRVSPEQKEMIISKLKSNGHTVAMTGDGVNDILALKSANCSIAMANGSSAARSVSHIVSLDNDFSKLPNVVEQGRRVINNLKRSCSLFLSKTIFAIIVTLIFSFFTLFNTETYPNYPFVTSNMMMWEMISIGFASFFLALQPSKDRLEGSFMKSILINAVPAGIAETIAVMLSLLVANRIIGNGYNQELFVTLAVFSFTLVSYVVLFKICLPLNGYRIVVFGGCVLAAIAVLLIDFYAFNNTLLAINSSLIDWKLIVSFICITLICSLVYFAGDLLIKKILHKSK